MKVIAIKKDNGMVSITYPCPNARGTVLIPEKKAIKGKPAIVGAAPTRTTPAIEPQDAIPDQPAVPAMVADSEGNIIPGLTEIESEDDFIKRVATHLNLPQSTEYKIMDNDELPNDDGDFFDAWAYGKAITVDMTKAREIHRERLRAARLPVLQHLDGLYMQALESGDTSKLSAIAAKKQMLRDLPVHKSVASAKTPSALRNAGIDILATVRDN